MKRASRWLPLGLCLLALCCATPAAAGGDDPTPDELAAMILHGNPAEHALVAAWLEGAGREELRTVFAALRRLRAERPAAPAPARHVPPGFRPPAPPASDPPDPWLPPDLPAPEEDLTGRRLVNLEARILELPVAALDDLLGKDRPTPEARTAPLTPDHALALLALVEAHPRAKVLSAPRLTVYDRQKANVNVLNQVSYVQDYDVEVGMGGTQVADPIIGVLQEGLTLDLTPTVQEDGRRVALACNASFAHVHRPIPEFETELVGKKVTIQLPELDVSRLQCTVSFPGGGWVLLGSGQQVKADDGEKIERFVLLHGEVLPEDALVAKEAPKER